MTDRRGAYPFLFGNLLCYAPFCYLSAHTGLPPLAVLPVSTVSCLLGILVALSVMGWWGQVRFTKTTGTQEAVCALARAGLLGWREMLWIAASPVNPAIWSGLVTSVILLAVPASYALPRVAVLSTGLAMKASTLAVAPLADLWNKEHIKPRSLAALGLCLVGVLLAASTFRAAMPALGWGLLAAYVLAYLARFRIMSPHKGSISFFATEHLATSCAALLVVLVATPFSQDLRLGWSLWRQQDLWLIGALSNGVGLFGGWVLLARRESSWSVPLNRSAAVVGALLAGLAAGNTLTWGQVAGLAAVLGAVLALR